MLARPGLATLVEREDEEGDGDDAEGALIRLTASEPAITDATASSAF